MGAAHAGAAGAAAVARPAPVAPHHAVAAAVGLVVAAVAAPNGAWAVYALDAVLAAAVAVALAVPGRFLLRRAAVLVPVVAFGLAAALVGGGPTFDVAGLGVSRQGAVAGASVVAKAAVGVLAAATLAAAVPVTGLLVGLDRLRVPRLMTAVAGFMVRYLEVVGSEAARMRVARLSRGDDPRWLWQARATAASTGVLFVRAYERGERVHVAMLARGYDGRMPPLWSGTPRPNSPRATAVLVGGVALALAATTASWVLR